MLAQYADVVKRALAIEQHTENFLKSHEGKKHPRLVEDFKGRNVGRNFQRNQPRAPGVRPQLEQAKTTGCKFCGKNHPGKLYWRKTGACYIYGSMNHQKKDCLKLVTASAPKPLIQGRAFALTQQEPQTSQEVLAGKPQQNCLL